jgi:hypothetical protein
MKKVYLFLFYILTSLTINAHTNTIYSKSYGQSENPAIIFIHGGPRGNSSLFEGTTAEKLAEKGFYVIVYDRLLEEYEFHIALVDDLGLELTRAGNLIIERIRKHISPMYRDKEGKLLINYGPTMDFSYHSLKVEYSIEEKANKYPYLGLKQFMTEREKRDFSFGKGVSEKHLPFKFD